MASKFIFSSVFLLVLFCLLFIKETSAGCNTAYACSYANGESLKMFQNRKMLSGLKVSLEGSSTKIKYGEKTVVGELRKVPTGPDPLHHHNIGNPIKPENP
ncbi:hypothetical protein MtrunA17_Chr2g0321881 [Medicago truncatula]|uniref:Clavata3/ESR (CLE) gene family member n=1 Tax=Medicago truncatula TaxID=3880 RepID=A2Q2P0_MEDTR|nr:protein CLAVATA 3 [Medicago truncatula]ABN06176.1 hypothetical protein MtrDRAFT_AC151522g30v2 [Medicago truncatula]RHN75497.1 hypothetical protein MtrunA17_Chr2g0321881 [Medicago truncatula]